MTQGLLSAPGPPTLTLRPYQVEAVGAVYDHLRSRDDSPCVVIPTAGGKTPAMARSAATPCSSGTGGC